MSDRANGGGGRSGSGRADVGRGVGWSGVGLGIGVAALAGLTLAPVWSVVAATAPVAPTVDAAATADASAPTAIVDGAVVGTATKAPKPTPTPNPKAKPTAAPSVAVYPPYVLPLSFDHARHAKRGISCAGCHAQAARSVSAKDNLMPGEQACRACHAIDRAQPQKVVAPGQAPARCDACHTGPIPAEATEPKRFTIPAPGLKFNHRLHAERGMECVSCHIGIDQGQVGGVGVATNLELPKMASCLECHDGRQAPARCAACHPTLPDGRLRTQFPAGRLAPSGSLRGIDAHTTTFRTDHKVAARDERYCATCHTQNECTECHAAGVIKPADFHPVDYATLHAVDARRNTPNCSSCHRNQTFCLGCHQRLGVAPDPEGGQAGRQPRNPFGTGTGVKRFHPPGWVRDDAGIVLTVPTPASHSFQARRNLRTCVSCHREESCLTCHSADPTRSMGINPHPSGFARSASCRALARGNTRACLKCHAPGAPALSCD